MMIHSFDTCSCSAVLKIENFLSLWQQPQLHASNARRVNEPVLCKGKYHDKADLFAFSCFALVELSTDLLVWSNPNQLNRRSAVATVILPLAM